MAVQPHSCTTEQPCSRTCFSFDSFSDLAASPSRMPKFFILENVSALKDRAIKKGAKSAADKSNSNFINVLFEALGYKVRTVILAATDFALPERRERLYKLGELVHNGATSCIDAWVSLLMRIRSSRMLHIRTFLNHVDADQQILTKRKYSSTKARKWVKEHKAAFASENLCVEGVRVNFKLNYKKVADLPTSLALLDCKDFWAMQPRHKSTVVFLMLHFGKASVMKKEGIKLGDTLIADANCSLSWSMGAIGINQCPCITTKSLMIVVFPEFSVVSDRTAFNLQGLDADKFEDISVVPHRERLIIAGEAFVMPMAGAIFHCLLAVAPNFVLRKVASWS